MLVARRPAPHVVLEEHVAADTTCRLQLEISSTWTFFLPGLSVEENLGLLSNDEVLAVLKDREADKQPVISRATPSEIQVGVPFGADGYRMHMQRARLPSSATRGRRAAAGTALCLRACSTFLHMYHGTRGRVVHGSSSASSAVAAGAVPLPWG